MPGEVQQDNRNGVRILTFGGTVGNALMPDLRVALLDALEAAIAADDVHAIVLTGADGTFSAGVNVMEYAARPAAPWIDVICDTIEQSAKPVVAAIDGACLGAGFALALSSHARVADRHARIALPDVRLGLIPSGGATQRLPRLVGAQTALAIMLAGKPVSATEPGLKRVWAQLVDGDVVDTAAALATQRAQDSNLRRTRDEMMGLSDPVAYLKALTAVASKLEDETTAEAGIVRSTEAALLLPFDQGIALESTIFEDCRQSAAAQAARHLMVAERRTSKVPGVDLSLAKEVTDVILTGRRGAFVETAIMALDAGWHVHLLMPNPSDAAALRDRISLVYASAAERGALDDAARAARLQRLHILDNGNIGDNVQIAFEVGGPGPALPENAIRVRVTEGDNARPGPDGPDLWLRLYAPAHNAPLAEIASAPDVSPRQVATVVKALGRARKTVIRATPFPGMIGRNLDWALCSAALALCDHGADPYDIDHAAVRLGYALGPFGQMDAAGLSVAVARLDHLNAARGVPPIASDSPARHLIGSKHTGRRAGRGFYIYENGHAVQDAALAQRLDEWRGAPQAELPNVALSDALEAAVVNEAARLLAKGIARRASDIDVILVKGSGLSRAKGGLLIQADMRGQFKILQTLKSLQSVAPHIWTPHDTVRELVKNGTGFFGRI